MNFKTAVYEQCQQAIAERLRMHKSTLNELIESAAEDAKNSSADPSDAGIAILQMEQANIQGQINELITMKTVMDTINPDTVSDLIAKGSLIKSGSNYYFLSVALGKISVDDKFVFAISSQSPLGSKLLGCRVGDSVAVNGKTIFVEEVS